ncbi:MAG: glycosyltransferase [Acidiferrobacterales bacterium]
MRHDLLDDKFGRFREIPLALARRGHEVQGFCLSYDRREEREIIDEDDSSGARITWRSVNAGRLKFPGLLRYHRHIEHLLNKLRPDVLWACSDSFYGIMGTRLARKTKTHCVFDLYDNFESFASTHVPGVLPLYRRAVRSADGVTCVSNALMGLVSEKYRRTKPTIVLSNAIQDTIFYPRDKNHCRRRLGLPLDAKIIGTAGALSGNRGIHALLEGFEKLAAQDKNVHLAVAGPRDRRIQIPIGPRVHDFGVLPVQQVPILISALDVAVICNRDSSFGRYCFPQKAYEIMACRVPVVAASLGTMKEMLDCNSKSLFEPENSDDLMRVVKAQLHDPFISELDVPTWDDIGERLERFLQKVVLDAPRRIHA